MAHKDDLYSYSLSVEGTKEDQLQIYEQLKDAGIIGIHLEPVGHEEAPYSAYFYPEQYGSGPEWNEGSMDELLHKIAVCVPAAVLTIDGENTEDQSVGFQKRFHGDLYQETRRVTTLPPLEEGRDVPFSERHTIQSRSDAPTSNIHILCEEYEGEEAIREFRILAVSKDEAALQNLMAAKIQKDEYGFIATNGISLDSAYDFKTEYDEGFIHYYILDEEILSPEKIQALLHTKEFMDTFHIPDGFREVLTDELRISAETRGYGTVDAEKTARDFLSNKMFQAILKDAFWFNEDSMDPEDRPFLRSAIRSFLTYQLEQDSDYFERIGAMPAYQGPENLKEILFDSIYDVARDHHLPVNDVSAMAENFFRNTDLRNLFNQMGPAPLAEGTDAFQDAVWACYDFAEEQMLGKGSPLKSSLAHMIQSGETRKNRTQEPSYNKTPHFDRD